jgi:hypothetical protein
MTAYDPSTRDRLGGPGGEDRGQVGGCGGEGFGKSAKQIAKLGSVVFASASGGKWLRRRGAGFQDRPNQPLSHPTETARNAGNLRHAGLLCISA